MKTTNHRVPVVSRDATRRANPTGCANSSKCLRPRNAWRRGCCLLATLLALGAGCDDSKKASPPASKLPAATLGSATITGHIHFTGNAPERKMVDVSTCQSDTMPYQEETIVVSPDGGLRDVVVYLKDAPSSSGESAPAAQLDQSGCRYVPHVLAVQVGQPLVVSTSDSAFHNVHWTSAANGDANMGFTPHGQSKTVHFEHPEFLAVRCDVHPWMSATIGIVPNPFFAVSAADGSFKIEHVPAGKYTLAAVHPILGEQTASVEVKADGTVDQTIEFGAKKK